MEDNEIREVEMGTGEPAALEAAFAEEDAALDSASESISTKEARVPEKPTKCKKGLILTVVLVVLLVGTGAALAIWRPWENPAETDQAAKNVSEVVTAPEEKTEIVELATSDPSVQQMWGQIADASAWKDVYRNGGHWSDADKTHFALQHAVHKNEMVACKKDHRLKTYTDEHGVDHHNDYAAGEVGCVTGEAVRQEARKFFGHDIVFRENESGAIIDGDGYGYFVDGDEFVNVASGATIMNHLDKKLHRAEMVGDKLVLHESLGWKCLEWADGSEVCPTEEDIAQYYSGNYQWTFVKSADGNYVFEKIEEVKDASP